MGSKIGWIVSGVLVAGLAVVIAINLGGPDISQPTRVSTQRGFLDLHQVTMGPEKVLGQSPTGNGDAGIDYARAVAAQKQQEADEANRRRFSSRPGEMTDQTIQELQKISDIVAQGARQQTMTYSTPEAVKVGLRYAPAQDLQAVSRALSRLGRHYFQKKQFDQAAEVFHRQFMLGYHMERERGHYWMVSVGMSVQMQAIKDLLATLKAAGKSEQDLAAIEEYRQHLDSVQLFHGNKQREFWKLKPQPGDVYNVAQNDQDRVWRVQALLLLGIVRYTTDNAGDLKHAEKLLDKYSNDADPMISAAAKAARNMTKEEFNMIGAG